MPTTQVLHRLPGRLRLRVPLLRHRPHLAAYLTDHLLSVEGVRRAEANPVTAKLLVEFDPRLDERQLLAFVETGLQLPEVEPEKAVLQALAPEMSWDSATASGLGVIVAGLAVKRWGLGPSALAKSLTAWDLAAGLAVVGGYPWARRLVERALARSRIPAPVFLSVASLATLLLRENVVGLAALCLTSVVNGLTRATRLQEARADGDAQEGGPGIELIPDFARLDPQPQPLADALGVATLGTAALVGVGTRDPRRVLSVLLAACPCVVDLPEQSALAAATAVARQRGLASAVKPRHPRVTTRQAQLHEETRRLAAQNRALALGSSTLGLALAASGRLTPIGASLWHSAVPIVIVGNSWRLAFHPLDSARGQVAAALEGDWQPPAGLTSLEAQARLRRDGPNQPPRERCPGLWQALRLTLRDRMSRLLLVTAGIAALLGHWRDALTVAAVIGMNAAAGVWQQRQAWAAGEAVRQLAPPLARVVRDGETRLLPAAEVVVGDLIVLGPGDRVPADARLSQGLVEVEQALVTGESAPVARTPGEDVYGGTLVLRGHAQASVTATGPRSGLGRLSSLVAAQRTPSSPLQRALDRLGQLSIWIATGLAAGVMALGLFQGRPLWATLGAAFGLAVAVIPEGLPAFVTLGLLGAMRRLTRRRALVRQLPAVEALSAATWLVCDKTGTLTQGTMRVRALWTGRRRDASSLLQAALLCNDGLDATERALHEFARAAGTRAQDWERLASRPFAVERRLMTVRCRGPQGAFVFVKGAPDQVFAGCRWQPGEGDEALTAARRMAEQGLRVLAVAGRPAPAADDDLSERGLTLHGLLGLQDPVRKEAPATVRRCREAGLHLLIVTGDHPATAGAVARQLGLEGQVAEAAALPAGDAALAEALANLSVVARALPEDKVRIVTALRAAGQTVAMVGDGANDAGALRAADVGIAMGQGGTEIARGASGLVLLDNHLGTLLDALEQGRQLRHNLRKAVYYLLSSNAGEVAVMLGSTALGLPYALSAQQLLWVNLVGDGLPALALLGEPVDPRLLQRPAPGNLLDRPLFAAMTGHGLRQGAAILAGYAWLLRQGRPLAAARGAAMAALGLGQVLHLFRSRHVGGRAAARPSAPLLAAGGLALLLLALPYLWPVLGASLGMGAMGLGEWLVVAGTLVAGTLPLSGGTSPVRASATSRRHSSRVR